MLFKETACVVRGIYHNTMFAKWWSLQIHKPDGVRGRAIERAITARFIMNNDISRVTSTTDERDLPYLMWYPDALSANVLVELARVKPHIAGQAAHACIALDYEAAYRQIAAKPDSHQLQEAYLSRNSFYHADLTKRARELGVDAGASPSFLSMDFQLFSNSDLREPRTEKPHITRGLDSIIVNVGGIYNGEQAILSRVERYVCAIQPPASIDAFVQEGDYNS